MAKPTKRRWSCPDCGVGVLAPGRLRKIDTRRYCLPCSEARGTLVERVCVAAAAQRERKAVARRQAPQRAAASLAARAKVEAMDGSFGVQTIDLLAEIEIARGFFPGCPKIELELRRPKGSNALTGRAYYSERLVALSVGERIHLTCGKAEELLALVMHEVAHVAFDASGMRGRGKHHPPPFKGKLLDACVARWPGIVVDRAIVRTPKAYDIDAAIQAELRRLTRERA
jgi:hypothetical protein